MDLRAGGAGEVERSGDQVVQLGAGHPQRRVAGEPVALLVDSIGSVVDVEDDQFEPPPDTLNGPTRELIRGAYKLSDRLLLSLDVDRAIAA